jgi:RNA-directed DNA polymerase
VFESVCGVIEQRLKLKVNQEKSSIRHAADATLLGFGFSLQGPHVRIRVAPKAVKRLKDQLRVLTRRNWAVSMPYRIDRINRFTTGWMAYFRLADTGTWSARRTGGCAAACGRSAGRNGRPPPLSGTTCGYAVSPSSTSRKWAGSSKGYWRVAGSQILGVALPNIYWEHLGLKTLTATRQRLKQTA